MLQQGAQWNFDRYREALGARSVRALLGLGLFGTIWGAMGLRPDRGQPGAPRDLRFVILGHDFPARRVIGWTAQTPLLSAQAFARMRAEAQSPQIDLFMFSGGQERPAKADGLTRFCRASRSDANESRVCAISPLSSSVLWPMPHPP